MNLFNLSLKMASAAQRVPHWELILKCLWKSFNLAIARVSEH